MQTLNAVIIHRSCIVLQGLRNILNSKNIPVIEMIQDCPALPASVKKWKETLLIVDASCLGSVQPHYPLLKKNRNLILGIAADQEVQDLSWKYDEMVLLSDSITVINRKIDSLLQSIRGRPVTSRLTGRETDILRLVAQGESNKQIAEKLFISIHTVITHRKHITEKLGIKTIAGLTLYAVINNLAD
jgi:DNA-binding CsgD family transcriptional regulator